MSTKKIAAVAVINDLVTDQRVYRVCTTLTAMGYEVKLIGRQKKDSLPMAGWPWQNTRFMFPVNTGPLFYLLFNLRLFFFLLPEKLSLIYCNDLDTLGAGVLAGGLKKVPVIYDSHELFTGVPELKQSRFKQRVWTSLERFCVKRVKGRITVSRSIASELKQRYGYHFDVVRNIPLPAQYDHVTRLQLGLPEGAVILILQGAGINIDRGAEELILAVKSVPGVLLLVIGGGDVWPVLEKMVSTHGLSGKVLLLNKMPKERLMQYTRVADIGVTIDKNTSLNYEYSLPNKLFDYIQAGIPILASRLKEVSEIVINYEIGEFVDSHIPAEIARAIEKMIAKLPAYKENLERASKELSWDNEKQTLTRVISAASSAAG